MAHIRVHPIRDRWWAECQRCTWELHADTPAQASDKGRAHVPRCGRELYLRPAEFTHAGDCSGIPIAVEWYQDPELIAW